MTIKHIILRDNIIQYYLPQCIVGVTQGSAYQRAAHSTSVPIRLVLLINPLVEEDTLASECSSNESNREAVLGYPSTPEEKHRHGPVRPCFLPNASLTNVSPVAASLKSNS